MAILREIIWFHYFEGSFGLAVLKRIIWFGYFEWGCLVWLF